jgi:hypothetical protein
MQQYAILDKFQDSILEIDQSQLQLQGKVFHENIGHT